MNATAETAALTESLRNLGLAAKDEEPRYQALTGGVSSQIWRVDLRSGPVCVKRALPKLRVEREWLAPVERNHYEFAWLHVVSTIAPHAVPRLICARRRAESVRDGISFAGVAPFVEDRNCADGRADPAFAAQLGGLLARIHRTTAHDSAIAAEFPTDAIFHSIRLEPYLEATALRHPDLAPTLHRLVKTTAASKHALVHGDVSPKNISGGAARSCVVGRGVRLVWRSGFRSRLLPESFVAEVSVDSRRLPPISFVASMHCVKHTWKASRGNRPTFWKRGPPRSCPLFSSRAWTASRPSSTSPRGSGSCAPGCSIVDSERVPNAWRPSGKPGRRN